MPGLSRGATGAALQPAPPPRPRRATERDLGRPEGAPCFRELVRRESRRSGPRPPPPPPLRTRLVREAAFEPSCLCGPPPPPRRPGLPRAQFRHHRRPVPQVQRLPRVRPRSPGKYPPSGVGGARGAADAVRGERYPQRSLGQSPQGEDSRLWVWGRLVRSCAAPSVGRPDPRVDATAVFQAATEWATKWVPQK